MRVQFLHGPLACGVMVDADLLGIPKDLGEFVVVHELVHQLVSNHGKVFKLFLDTYIPDREEKERQLQAYMVEITHLGKVDGGVFLLTPLANGWLINIVGP